MVLCDKCKEYCIDDCPADLCPDCYKEWEREVTYKANNDIVNDYLDKLAYKNSLKDHIVSAKDAACGVDYINEIRYALSGGDIDTATIILDLLQDIVTGERHCDSDSDSDPF
jgi:hypothetical protein